MPLVAEVKGSKERIRRRYERVHKTKEGNLKKAKNDIKTKNRRIMKRRKRIERKIIRYKNKERCCFVKIPLYVKIIFYLNS